MNHLETILHPCPPPILEKKKPSFMKPVPLAKTAGDHCFIEQHACKSLAIDLQTSRKLAMLKNRSKHIQSLWNQFCFLKNTVFFFLIMWTFFFFFFSHYWISYPTVPALWSVCGFLGHDHVGS